MHIRQHTHQNQHAFDKADIGHISVGLYLWGVGVRQSSLHVNVCSEFTRWLFLPFSQSDVQPDEPSQTEGAEGPRRHDHGQRFAHTNVHIPFMLQTDTGVLLLDLFYVYIECVLSITTVKLHSFVCLIVVLFIPGLKFLHCSVRFHHPHN